MRRQYGITANAWEQYAEGDSPLTVLLQYKIGAKDMSISGKKFIIDAGHGGRYDGVTHTGLIGGTKREKDFALTLAQKLRSRLIAQGASVWMTRTGDTDFGGATAGADINARVSYINSNLPAVDVLVSVHLNTCLYGRVGAFYQEGTIASKNLATKIARYYGGGSWGEDFAILRDTTRASAKVLMEMATICDANLSDDAWLNARVNEVMSGLNDYFA